MLLDLHARFAQHLDVAATDEQVLPPVVVKIEQPNSVAAHWRAEDSQPALSGYFVKAFALRASKHVEQLPLQRRKNDVGITVIINVSEVHSHARDKLAVFNKPGTHFQCNFFELLSSVMKQEVKVGVVGDKQVWAAVQIVV